MITKTLALLCMIGGANNPFLSGQFAADPTARVFNNKVYVYPSHDIVPPTSQSATATSGQEGTLRQDWFCMADYHVFSSENLTDWTDHGVILSQENVPWGNPTGYSMWAPDCVEKNGKYYFYFPNAPKGSRGFAVGVATADSPEGPFTCEPEPIKGIFGIDPCVLTDNDGQDYIYWSGMGIRGARLKPNMKELDGDSKVMEGLPEGFKEGPFVFRRGDWYYLTFPWVRKEGGTETLAYAMSKSPLGPWDFKGIIMAEHDNGCWTNHHSILEYQGQWYIFYHHNDYSPKDDKRRSPRIDKISFRADGTIVEVKPTLRGVGVSKATSRIDVDRYSTASTGTTVTYNDSIRPFYGWHATLPTKSSWLCYNDVDFSPLHADGYMTACIKAKANTVLFVRERNAKGKIIAQLPVNVITEQGPFRRDQSGKWLTLTAPIKYLPKGITDICLTTEGDSISIDWLQFKNRPDYFSPIAANPSHPDEQGFIRQWLLLEPIDNPANTNLLFSYDYLQKHIAGPENLPKPLPTLPRDGQKVKVNKQSLAWHALESNTYNVRLFRFADILQKQTYRVLFWATTIIDCEEDIPNVRLAAGSNGASMWWLNDTPVLTLESDRRMVADDGMSPRLTLKKGRNILRCAVVNGPGLSDFCVRFVNEEGKPVTNYELRVKN